LADFDQRASEAETIADADARFHDAVSRDIFSECARLTQECMVGEPLTPEGIMVARIVVNGFVRATMDRKIGLFVAFDPEKAHTLRPHDRGLGDRAFFAFVAKTARLSGEDCVD